MHGLKFRGAGQGVKALVAERVAGELARVAGPNKPELVLVQLDPDLARTEPDAERLKTLVHCACGPPNSRSSPWPGTCSVSQLGGVAGQA